MTPRVTVKGTEYVRADLFDRVHSALNTACQQLNPSVAVHCGAGLGHGAMTPMILDGEILLSCRTCGQKAPRPEVDLRSMFTFATKVPA